MNFREEAITFHCEGDWLQGIATIPNAPSARGVVIVVGGPQYRAGSHRQFVLLARFLAANGIPVFRFDYRGMGDGEGAPRTFDAVHGDVRAAIDQFKAVVPAIEEVVLWGLCDAASAALFYAHHDRRVVGLVLLNPWMRTEQGIATAYLKHYYRGRLFEPALWKKVFRGRFDYLGAMRSLAKLVRDALPRLRRGLRLDSAHIADVGSMSLPQRMCEALKRFNGRVLLILSGKDLTAKEFIDMVGGSREWRRLLKSARVSRFDLPQANHTFARREWRDQVAVWTMDWIKAW
jgi:exosortase A-associated hydrolase 1